MFENYDEISEIRSKKVYLIKTQDGSKYYLKKYQAQDYPYLLNILLQLQGKKFNNIVRIYEIKIKISGKICVFEEACQCNLRQLMKNEEQKFDISEKLQCLLDVIEGLLELKNIQIFHRDIKPDNIVYDGQNFKIIDFDTAKSFQDDRIKLQSIDIGTPNYRAPEIVQGGPYSSKCDIWSLGCLFYFILFQRDMREKQGLVIPQKHNYNYDDKIIQLLPKMLEEDPTKRINLETLKVEVSKLHKLYSNQSVSTQLEQNISSAQNQEQDVKLDDKEKFNDIMVDLIGQEKNQQQKISLYQFWAKRVEIKWPQANKLRQQIGIYLLAEITQCKRSKIKINEFASIDEIKNQLKCIERLIPFNDF